MSEQAGEETTEEVETPEERAEESTEDTSRSDADRDVNDEPETFLRKVVEDLRKENADYRTKAKRAHDLAGRLHTALVTATGRLADPSDLAFDDAHLDSPEALTTALDELLARKPHLASRRIVGDVGQGASPGDSSVDLAGMLRARAT